MGFSLALRRRAERKDKQAAATLSERPENFTVVVLVPENGRGIRIFSEGFRIALGENFHHPVMEIIHGMILNRAETTIVFLAGFIEITAQPVTDILVLASRRRTSLGRNSWMSCMATLATRFARRCRSCNLGRQAGHVRRPAIRRRRPGPRPLPIGQIVRQLELLPALLAWPTRAAPVPARTRSPPQVLPPQSERSAPARVPPKKLLPPSPRLQLCLMIARLQSNGNEI